MPRFLTHIADELGQESVRLIHNLLEHGRLRCASAHLQACCVLVQHLPPVRPCDAGGSFLKRPCACSPLDFLTSHDCELAACPQQRTATRLRRWDQLLKAVCSEAAEEGGEEEAPPDPEILANKFRSLVLERYVERAPPCNLPPPTQQVRTLRHAWAASPLSTSIDALS